MDDGGRESRSTSEERLGSLLERGRAARERVGVRLREECISPRLFLGVASLAGLLWRVNVSSQTRSFGMLR